MKIFNKGFTLVELIVSVFIIALMSTIFWANLHVGYKKVVELETERIASEIRQVRSMAVSRIPEETTGEYPPGGYGISFSNSPPSYIVFASMDDITGYSPGTDILLKTGTFEDEIEQLIELTNGSAATFYFRFRSPNEVVTNIRK